MEGINIFKYLVDCFLSVIYPKSSVCLSCKEEKNNEYDFLCLECKSNLTYVKEAFYINDLLCESIIYYSSAMRELLIDFKYKRNFEVGDYFISLIVNKIKKEKLNFDYITFVPGSKNTIKKRGFDQCEYLARGVSKKIDIPLIQILEKSDVVLEQKTLTAEQRKRNIENAFILKKNINRKLKENLIQKKVLLLDDVITTGSTLNICKKNLEKVNKIQIHLLTVMKSSI